MKNTKTSLLWLGPALLAVGLFSACTEDNDGFTGRDDVVPTVKCCSCVCGDADGQVCANLESSTTLTDSCDSICEGQCGATLGCSEALSVQECAADPGGKKDDPCTRTCNVAASCGITLYADEGDCQETCEANPTSAAVADCLEAAQCTNDLLAYCMEGVENAELAY